MNLNPISHLPRDANGNVLGGQGRKPGTPETTQGVLAMIKAIFADPERRPRVEAALFEGLTAKPPRSFPYQQMAAHYLDGKPIDTLRIESRSVVIGIGVDATVAPPFELVVGEPAALEAAPSAPAYAPPAYSSEGLTKAENDTKS